VRIPDYISPIIGYRIWQWDAAGLKSLNGELWFPHQPLSAVCRADARGSISGLSKPAAHDAGELPSFKCTCGVYAAKSREHMNRCGSAVAQLERDLIRERVKAGLRNAKLKGKILGRPTLILDRDRIARLRASGASIREIAAQLEVSTATVHSVLRQR